MSKTWQTCIFRFQYTSGYWFFSKVTKIKFACKLFSVDPAHSDSMQNIEGLKNWNEIWDFSILSFCVYVVWISAVVARCQSETSQRSYQSRKSFIPQLHQFVYVFLLRSDTPALPLFKYRQAKKQVFLSLTSVNPFFRTYWARKSDHHINIFVSDLCRCICEYVL